MRVQRDLMCHIRTAWANLSDAVFAVLVVVAALIAWSPRVGVAAARDAIAARRRQRQREGAARELGGDVWLRHARRQRRGRRPTPASVALNR